jgi:hypothetical protein
MAKVLDPLATAYAGAPAREIKPAVASAWKDEFGVELPEPVLSRCAAQISRNQPWVLAFWSNDWP